jgi:tryptophan-rich sensory protein
LAKTIFAFLNVSLVALYAIGSGFWVNTGDGFYRSLKRPFWQPPDFVFGLAWPYNFLVLIIAGILVANNANSFFRVLYTVLFAFSVVTALLWAYSFYIQHNLILAAISLSVTALLTIPMVVIAFQTKAWFGLILIPYQLWLIIATSLSIGYQVLNKA